MSTITRSTTNGYGAICKTVAGRETLQPSRTQPSVAQSFPEHQTPELASRYAPTSSPKDESLSDAVFSEDYSDKVRSKQLQAIREMGRMERWLIPAEQIFLPALTVQCIADSLEKKNQPGAGASEFGAGFLGSGSFAAVFKGKYLCTDVAIKLSLRGDMRCLPSEMRLLRWLRHPNIVTFYGACIVEVGRKITDIALVEEFIRGKNLTKKIEESGQMMLSTRCEIMIGICSAITYLHCQNPPVVHGDLKPDNVLVQEPDLRPKVIDFGFSGTEDTANKIQGKSPSWAAPEVLTKAVSHPAAAADIFSLGRVVFYIATGISPLGKPSRVQLHEWAATEFPPLPWPSNFQIEFFVPACQQCLHMDPTRRSLAEAVLKLLSTNYESLTDPWDAESVSSQSPDTTASSTSYISATSNNSSSQMSSLTDAVARLQANLRKTQRPHRLRRLLTSL
eukprot:TRINITY_DN27306_c0_g1_i1.p1 TRINITY_DN27306_c0_g1~~TRINITY_DN27306_c0_g1_i1.p1  ORF type:complete len:449 (-),score=69.00 TRINITY_DN27306_c0_g1_i1:225-1571(-)